MAASVVDLLVNPDLLVRAQETFRREIGGATYHPLLPPGQMPPLELNVEEMKKYREAMRAHYSTAPIIFR